MRDVYVRALKNYDNYAEGQEFWLPMTEATAHLIVSHYLMLLWDPTWEQGYGASGHVQARPGGDE